MLLDPLVTWSCKIIQKTEPIYLHYHNAYGHKTRQDGDWPWASSTHKVWWSYVVLQDYVTNWNDYISITTMPRATKLGREEKYNEEQDPSVMWSRKSREKLDAVSLPPQSVWPPNSNMRRKRSNRTQYERLTACSFAKKWTSPHIFPIFRNTFEWLRPAFPFFASVMSTLYSV